MNVSEFNPTETPAARYGWHALHRRRGFTLTELMIAVALVLLLTVAMTKIFATTRQAISKGTAVDQTVRGLDAGRTAIQIDLTGTDTIGYAPGLDQGGIVPSEQMPFLMIASMYVATWPNEQAARADVDYVAAPDLTDDADQNNWTVWAATLDLNNDGEDDNGPDGFISGVGTGEFNPLAYGLRTFRTDQITYFTKGKFETQSGDDVARYDLDANAAMVTIGHGKLFNGDYAVENSTLGYGAPGMYGTGSSSTSPRAENRNNRFADKFVLVRRMQLLKSFNAADADGSPTIIDRLGQPVNHYRANWADPNDPTGSVTPLDFNSQAVFGGNVDQTPRPVNNFNGESRYDVAGVTLGTFRDRMRAVTDQSSGSAYRDPFLASDSLGRGPATTSPWWTSFPFTHFQRYWSRQVAEGQTDSRTLSQRSNVLLDGARQFMVEYAGDYLTQDANGRVTAVGGDGVVDFAVIDTDPTNVVSGPRRTLYYGFPRDVDGDGYIGGVAGGLDADPAANSFIPGSVDVVPLRTILSALPAAVNPTNQFAAPFEKTFPLAVEPQFYMRANNVVSPAETVYPINRASNGVITNSFPNGEARYTCAWSPWDVDGNNAGVWNYNLAPQLLRFIIQATDDRGRLENGITQELVYRVPQQ